MKLRFISLFAIAAMLPVGASAQLPGLAIAGSASPSELPYQAVSFINNAYPGNPISNCTREFATGGYDVTLADGTMVDFNARGQVTLLEAPDSETLPQRAVLNVLPERAIEQLASTNDLGRVSTISMNSVGGYNIALAQAPTPVVNAVPPVQVTTYGYSPYGYYGPYGYCSPYTPGPGAPLPPAPPASAAFGPGGGFIGFNFWL